MAKKTVNIEFDVALARGSAESIRSELESVLADVGRTGITIDSVSVSPGALSSLKSEIQSYLGYIPLRFSYSGGGFYSAVDSMVSEARESVSAALSDVFNQYKGMYGKLGDGLSKEDLGAGILNNFDFSAVLDGFGEFQSSVISGMAGIRDAIQGSIEQLVSLGATAKEVAGKEFSSVLDFSGAFKSQNVEQIDEYKAKIRDYVQYARDAATELINTFSGTHGRSGLMAAGIDTVNLSRTLFGAGNNDDVLTTLDNYLKKLDSKKTLNGLQEVGDNVKDYVSNIRGALEALNKISANGAVIDLDKLFNVPEKPVTAAKQATDAFSSITDALQALSQGAQQNAGQAFSQEAAAIEQSNQSYESHSAAVDSAANAERLKAAVSQEVATSVGEEASAVEQVAEASALDVEAATASASARRNNVSAIAAETAALQENAEIKEEAMAGDGEEVENQQAYDKLLKRVASSLRLVQTAKHALESTTNGVNLQEYGDLSSIESELQFLKEMGESNPLETISSSLDDLTRRFEEAKQAINVYTMALKDYEAAQRASSQEEAYWAEREAAAEEAMRIKEEQISREIALNQEAAEAEEQALARRAEAEARWFDEQETKREEQLRNKLEYELRQYETAEARAQKARSRGDTIGYAKDSDDAQRRYDAYVRLADGITDYGEKLEALNLIDERRQVIQRAGDELLEENTRRIAENNNVREQSTAVSRSDASIASEMSKLSAFTSTLVQSTQAYKDWIAARKSYVEGTGATVDDMNAAAERVRDIISGLSTSGGIGSKLDSIFGRVSGRIGMMAFTYATRAIREMISAVKELDSSLTQMQIVTGGTDDQIETFSRDIAQTAKEIGSSITDLVDSATVFARLGYSEDESSILAKYTAMLANVGNIDVSTSQDAITSIVKAFGMGVGDIESVMDKMVEVGNHFPISVSQIAEGMMNAGSTLKVAGNDIEQSIALLTAANTSMQNVNKASTGLRTIAARLRRSEVDLNELGETVTTAKYQQMVDMLTKHSVSLTDENGELRDTYSIIQDIAGAWDDMSKNEQAALAEMAAGTRQQNVFTSLILNFKEAEKSMDAMKTSAGSLSSAYEIYTQSIDKHIGTFKASLQDLGQSMFDSGMMTGAIDFASRFVEALKPVATMINDITHALGGAEGVITLIVGGTVLKNVGALAQSLGVVQNLVTAIIDAMATGGVADTFAALAKSLNISNLALGLGGVAAAVTAIAFAINKYKQHQEEIRKSTEEAAKSQMITLKGVQSIADKYSEISGKEQLSEEDMSELQSLQSQLNQLVGAQAGQIDLVNGKYDEEIQKLNEVVAAQAKATYGVKKGAVEYAVNDVYKAFDDRVLNDDDKALRNLAYTIDSITGKTGRTFGDTYGYSLQTWLDGGTRSAMELQAVLGDIANNMSVSQEWRDAVPAGHTYSSVMADISSMYNKYGAAIANAKKELKEFASVQLSIASSEIDNPLLNEDDFIAYRNALISSLSSDSLLRDAYDKLISADDLAAQVDSVMKAVAPKLYEGYMSNIGGATETVMKDIVNTMPAMVGKSGLLIGLDEVTDNISNLYEWLDKINSGDFAAKDLFEMLEEFPTLQDAADGVENLSTDLWKLADAVQGAINAAPEDMIKRIDTYMNSHILSENVKSQMETWKEYLRSMTDLTNVSMPERVAKIKEMQSAIYDAVGDSSGLTLEKYNSLIKLNSEFADAIEVDGDRVAVNVEKAMDIVRKMGDEYTEIINDQIEVDRQRIDYLDAIEKARGSLTDAEEAERSSLEQNIQKYQILRSEILNTLSAYEQWTAAQGTANAGAEVDELKSAFDYINKVTKGGKDKDALFGQWNTDDMRAALALLGKDVDDFVNNGVFDNKKAQNWLSGLNKYLNKGKQGVDDFLLAIRDAGLATYDNGLFQILDGTTLGDIADAFGTSEEFVKTMLEFSTRFHDLDFSYIIEEYEKEREAIDAVALAREAEVKSQESVGKLDAVEKENTGLTNLLDLYDQLRQAESQRAQAQDMGAQGLVESMDQQIQTIRDGISSALSEPVDMTSVDSIREAINNAIQALNEEMQTKSDLGIEFDKDAIQTQIDALQQDLSDIEAVVEIKSSQESEANLEAMDNTINAVTQSFMKALQIMTEEEKINIDDGDVVSLMANVAAANAELDRLSAQRTINIIQKVIDFGKIKTPSGNSGGGVSGAYGGAFASGGNTLVGELGQEMVVDPENRYWYTVGDNGPEFIKLPKHAIVFNHKQTKSLLSRGKTNDRGTALASGTALAVASGAGGAQKKLEDVVTGLIGAAVNVIGGGTADLKRVNGKGKGKGRSSGGGGGGSGSGSGSSKKSSDKDNWFIKQYKENNHLIKMDKKEQKDYLNWLDGAYKKAYKQGIIDLDDYYKYQEEVYEGLKDLFLDSIDDTQSKIDEMMNYDGAGKQIVNYYNQIINSVQKELKAAYARGLDDNDDYVQELKSQYWEYANALKEFEEGIVDDAKDATEELIRYRMKMITKELNDEKDNLQERLKSMKDFYDEQKKLLHESADNEDYLKEQAEKRKQITDLEIQLSQLALDNSVKAQRKRLELEEELVKARDELYTFERDHTIDIIEDEYDKMYDTAEKATDAQIEDIDEKLEDQKYLYQQALEDLRNNNLALYNEMIAYNEHYIDGTGDALVDMWERAYEALYEYSKLYGKTFEGIQLGNFTNWQPTTSNVGTLKINGRKYAKGTQSAKAGLHRVDEIGPEQVFVSDSGQRYRLFNGGEKVLNAKATQFLYDFANSGGSIISDALRKSAEAIGNMSRAAASIGTVAMGDIIIQGNASEKTVSEIRRSQRESVDYLLKEFRKLNK